MLADLANTLDIRHFVYASAGGAECNSQIPSWESKWGIEKHIRALGLPATILRPVAYMENYLSPLAGIQAGKQSYFFPADAVSLVITMDDIGAFAALVFRNPLNTLGRPLSLRAIQSLNRKLLTHLDPC